MHPTLRAKRLTELLIDEIKVLIEADSLQPGDRMPTEQELMRIFKVSRTSVREALSVLRQEGVVDIIQGKGTFLKKHYTPLPGPSPRGLMHFVEARKVLETTLAGLAAERASDEDFASMERAITKLEEADVETDPDEVVQADLEFHYALAGSADNPVLLHFLQEVDSRLQKGRSTTILFPQGKKKAIEGHRRVLDALKLRAPDEAARQMGRHIGEIEKAQQSILALQGGQNREGEKRRS